MNASDLIPLLGLPIDAPEVTAMLAKLETSPPKRASGRASASNDRLGIEIQFTDERIIPIGINWPQALIRSRPAAQCLRNLSRSGYID